MAINPVVTRNGRRIPTTAEAWLERRDIGATLDIQDVTYTTRYDKSSSGHRVITEVATVSGELVVSDVERFTDVLCHGLGRGRAYGCGLVSIVAET
jgi:CRISPR system Cascade subunit CasE